jgi:hypothetical protein
MTAAHHTLTLATTADDAVVLRPAHQGDHAALRRLAALDSAAPLAGRILLAERDGEISAALELRTGRSIADPFRPTAGLVDLLEARAALLRRAALGRRRGALTLLRRARAAA